MILDTFSPDTPHHVLSDYTEERCHELGLPCVRDDNGLTVTVPAKPDGLPDWETFLRVCHDLRAADGWVMEGAEPGFDLSRTCVFYSRSGGWLVNCKSCNTDLHPYYQKKYDGYCLNCINAGAAEKDEQISRMERQLAAAERLYAATRDYLNAWEDTDELETNLKDALTDYANAKGEK